MNMYKLRGGEDNVVQLHNRRIRAGESDEGWLSPHLGGRSDSTRTPGTLFMTVGDVGHDLELLS
jgi:hypothetical protein